MTALRGYQVEAVEAVTTGLGEPGARGQVHAACGTGKTLVALHGARRLLDEGGLVVIACPSLALIAQTLDVWASEQAPDQVLAVCSDEGVGDSLAHVNDLGCTIACAKDTVAAWLQGHRSGLRLVVTTHLSAPVLGEALRTSGTRANLLIVDEAHRTAGRTDKLATVLHDDDKLPADRRLYMTATPRYISAGVVSRSGEVPLVGMDDEAVYGPVLHSYPFGQAIADGWLDDFQVAVIGVRAEDALRTLQKASPDAVLGIGDTPLRMAVIHTALAQAAREWDLRRVIAFTPRVSDAQDFAISLPRTLHLLGHEAIPKRELTSEWVSGRMDIRQREARLRALRDPPRGGWTVVANARCLGEGVDVPAVDGILFTHPKQSTVDVIQSVGRALRRSPDGSGVATVIVPVLLPDEPDPAVDRDGEWRVLWQVLRALRAHDQSLGAELDGQARWQASHGAPEGLPGRILVRMPDGYDTEHYLRHITVKIIQSAVSPWIVRYEQARRFYEQYGHLRVPAQAPAPWSGLDTWIRDVRAGKYGVLTEQQRSSLNEIGMQWDPLGDLFDAGLDACRRFRERYGHLNVPSQYVDEEGFRTGSWVRARREDRRVRGMPADRVAALDELGMVWEGAFESRFRAGMEACRQYYESHGNLNVPSQYVNEDGYRLGKWVKRARALRREGKLTQQQILELDELGMKWSDGSHSKVAMPLVQDDRRPRPGIAEVIAAYVRIGTIGGAARCLGVSTTYVRTRLLKAGRIERAALRGRGQQVAERTDDGVLVTNLEPLRRFTPDEDGSLTDDDGELTLWAGGDPYPLHPVRKD